MKLLPKRMHTKIFSQQTQKLGRPLVYTYNILIEIKETPDASRTNLKQSTIEYSNNRPLQYFRAKRILCTDGPKLQLFY